MAFGVTPEGFTRPSVQEIKESIERDEIASIDPTLDIATDPVVGQINGIFAQQLGKAWEALETAYEAFDPDKAEDDRLASLSKLTGTSRRGATYSLVTVTCTFANDGVVLEAGVHFANVVDRPDIRFTPVSNFTSTAAGSAGIVFRAENLGPVAAGAGSIAVIATPVTGWDAVSNALDATVGRNVETDAELRLRREEELAKPGSAHIKAIKADLLEIDEIISVVMFENATAFRDDNGLPPHSFQACIWAGEPFAAQTSDIGQAIWDSKAAGAEPVGNTSGLAFTGDNPSVVLVFFEIAQVRQIYLRYDVIAGPGWVGASEFALTIATELNKMHGIGDDVISERLQALAFDRGLDLGVTDLPLFRLGLSGPATGTSNLAIDSRSIARFDTTRIIVNVT